MSQSPDVTGALDGYVRVLRRRADASQREMAARSGVPLSTIVAIESGRLRDVRLGTMARLAQAGNCRLALVDETGAVVDPHQEPARDLGGRRLPAHLDVRPWVRPDYWFPHEHGPFTFDRERDERDRRRLRAQQAKPIPIPLPLRLKVERLEKWLGSFGWVDN